MKTTLDLRQHGYTWTWKAWEAQIEKSSSLHWSTCLNCITNFHPFYVDFFESELYKVYYIICIFKDFKWEIKIWLKYSDTQDYQQKMRLQRRLSIFWCIQDSLLAKPVLNHNIHHQNTKLNAETKTQALNRHIFRVLGRLYSLIPCG